MPSSQLHIMVTSLFHCSKLSWFIPTRKQRNENCISASTSFAVSWSLMLEDTASPYILWRPDTNTERWNVPSMPCLVTSAGELPSGTRLLDIWEYLMLVPGLETRTGRRGSPSPASSWVLGHSACSGIRSETEQIFLFLVGSSLDRVASDIWSLREIHFFQDSYGNTPKYLADLQGHIAVSQLFEP